MISPELMARAHLILDEADIPELPNHYRGKVRDNYDLPDGRRILIATDRLSAFDIALAAIPCKGQVLTQTARFWYPDPNVVIAQHLNILPVEIVVRGYLAGSTGTSILTMYNKGQRSMYGVTLPDGMRDNQILPHPIITPTTKAADGGHDMPLTPAEIVSTGLLPAEQWEAVTDYALALFARGQKIAAERGLILVDTKYEFGTDPSGRIVLADEIHTPDSSRYWFQDSYPASFEAGTRPASFDKDVVRAWVAARCDPYKDPIPEIPAEIVLETAQVYIAAFERITGLKFAYPDVSEPVLTRIRRNLAALF